MTYSPALLEYDEFNERARAAYFGLETPEQRPIALAALEDLRTALTELLLALADADQVSDG